MNQLLYHYENPEVLAVRAFLDWQQIPYKAEETSAVLGITKGKDLPVFRYRDKELIGFFEIVEYMQSAGLILI